jgi:hypothetical protein
VNIKLYPELSASDKTFYCGDQTKNFVYINSDYPLTIYNSTTILYYKITVVFNLIAVDSNKTLEIFINGQKSNDALSLITSSLGSNPSDICNGLLFRINI